MGVVLWLTSAGLLIASALLGQRPASPWLQVLASLLQWASSVVLLFAALYTFRNPLRQWIEAHLVKLTGPALIRSMPPRAVLASLLQRVYGTRSVDPDILNGILGGAGRDPGGGDTVISRSTTAHFAIESVSDTECITYLTWTHEYSSVRDNHLFVIFATSDHEVASAVANERVFPLYELLIVDDDVLDDFVPQISGILKIGIRYVDGDGASHVVEPRLHRGDPVPFRNYDDYVRLPDHVDRKNLRIIRVDLHDLADDEHVVASVEALTVHASNVAAFDHGYLTWTPPHPCFVRTISFDVSHLARAGQELVHMVVLATMKRAGLQTATWTPLPQRVEVPVDAWMLPGHSVTLLYRPTSAAELPDAPSPGRRS
jgi:hypothetical protein